MQRAAFLALSAAPLLLGAQPARAATSRSVVTYSDGVGLVDASGRSLARLRCSATALEATNHLGVRWTLPVSACKPGMVFRAAGVDLELPYNYFARYSTRNSYGYVYTDAGVQVEDSSIGSSVVKVPPKPNPQDTPLSCAIASADLLGAAIAFLAADASFADGPVLWGVDFWLLMAAAANFVAAWGNFLDQCAS